MRSIISMLVIIALFGSTGNGQLKFRSGIFLHHSTGACIWGPNGSATSIPQQITSYNTSHSYSGSSAVSLDETGWPVTPWDNEWERWHRIYYNMDADADIRPILAANKIVMIKSCFPSSDMEGVGVPEDTLTWTSKTIFNYKWHWRKIIEVMKQHPSNFFVIWTNAPLVVSADDQARSADEFCRWAKDTLAAGLDVAFGPFPKNVYVFDFFHKLAGADGKLPLTYAVSSEDSHPNADATALVAPVLVQEVFDAAIAYENSAGTLVSKLNGMPEKSTLGQNYPNPFNPTTIIPFSVTRKGIVRIRVFDALGHLVVTLVNGEFQPGTYEIEWNAVGLASGTYKYRLDMPGRTEVKKAILLK